MRSIFLNFLLMLLGAVAQQANRTYRQSTGVSRCVCVCVCVWVGGWGGGLKLLSLTARVLAFLFFSRPWTRLSLSARHRRQEISTILASGKRVYIYIYFLMLTSNAAQLAHARVRSRVGPLLYYLYCNIPLIIVTRVDMKKPCSAVSEVQRSESNY